MHTHRTVSALLFACLPGLAHGQGTVDLAKVSAAGWRTGHQTVLVATEGSRQVLRIEERATGGVVWSPALLLADGDIEVDVRGRDLFQKSFLGVAFHVRSSEAFEVVWLRPFNFQTADSARHTHAIQYAAYPDFSWQVLRERHPGLYEAPVPSGIAPEAWVHLRVEVRGKRVRVFINNEPSPSLSVEARGPQAGRGVGLWVGDNSPGDFANLQVRSTPAPENERYGFVAMLGRDTISVERVARIGDKLVSDQVDRFPRVVRRQTEITLAPDKSVRRFAMDLSLPTAVTPKWRERRVTADFDRDSVRITVRNGEGTQAMTLATAGVLTVPWSSQMYSLVELYAAAAAQRAGDSIAVQLIFPDAQIDEMRLGHSFARRRPEGRVEVFRHDMLAGTGEARLDKAGRMLSYSGARTTFKNEVARVSEPPDVERIAREFEAKERRANDIIPLSVRDTARGIIGPATLLVDYGRPLARGRDLIEAVIPFGEVWRTGANAATQFMTSAAISIGGLDVPPGTYSLWSLPTREGTVLIVNKQFGQWGTQYDASRDLGRVPVAVASASTTVEALSFTILSHGPRSGSLVLEWGRFKWTVPIAVK